MIAQARQLRKCGASSGQADLEEAVGPVGSLLDRNARKVWVNVCENLVNALAELGGDGAACVGGRERDMLAEVEALDRPVRLLNVCKRART